MLRLGVRSEVLLGEIQDLLSSLIYVYIFYLNLRHNSGIDNYFFLAYKRERKNRWIEGERKNRWIRGERERGRERERERDCNVKRE